MPAQSPAQRFERERRSFTNPVRTGNEITLCVSCHDDYLHFLPRLLERWEDLLGDRPWTRVLALDGCDYSRKGWARIRGQFGGPAPLRSRAARIHGDGWIFYWDADNRPESELVEAIESAVHHDRANVGVYHTVHPAYPADCDIRKRNYVDSASLWRKSAINAVGGWDSENGCLEDWELALRLRRSGYGICSLGVALAGYNNHKNSRSRGDRARYLDALCHARSIGVMVPFRGRKDLALKWFDAFEAHDWPRKPGLTILDKSGDPDFRQWLIARSSSLKVSRLTLIESPKVEPPLHDEERFAVIHNSVGGAYAEGMGSTPEDLVLTWEDDVIPESPEALKNLILGVYPNQPFDVLAAVVPERNDPRVAIASRMPGFWSGFPVISDLKRRPEKIGMVGGGFTLWHRYALENCPFEGMRRISQGPLGWDGSICRRLNQKQFRVGLHGDIRCAHDQ